MKIKLPVLVSLLAVALTAFAADQLVLSTSTKAGGVTTTVTVGRIQGDPAADGSITIAAIPRQVITLADGTVISDGFAGEWIQVKLSPATVTAINADIAATKTASDKAKAEAAKAAADAATAAKPTG